MTSRLDTCFRSLALRMNSLPTSTVMSNSLVIESTGQVTAVSSGIDEKGDVKAGVNAASRDDGAAYRLLRTLSAPMMDASNAILKRNSAIPILQGSAQPHLLLVDDNNIYLKMLGMFVDKCGIPLAQSTSVLGGQEAIEAFKAFEGRNNTARGFDIILMDLSMPEVSGFNATSAIRQIEKASDQGHRAYIVALTGLVSDKDRSAAYEAGVDDYVTKPAGLQKVRKIIETWQGRRHDFDRVSNWPSGHQPTDCGMSLSSMSAYGYSREVDWSLGHDRARERTSRMGCADRTATGSFHIANILN
jgi:CheY-like chemotaxis protein